MKNFTSVTFASGKKTKNVSYDGKKGHAEEVKAFVNAVQSGNPMPISFQEIMDVSEASIAAVESMNTGSIITIS